MAIALPLVTHLFAPLHDAVQWLAGGPMPRRHSQRPSAGASWPVLPAAPSRGARRPASAASARVQRNWGGPLRAPQATAQAARAVRVLRAAEACSGRAGAGRMVISGRLADVCAELDRLAAQEGLQEACAPAQALRPRR